jgi:hypothetical protein
MPTFIEQFADAEIKVRYKEPLLTAGLDQMLTGITPQGIHRGFRLATHVSNLTVTVQADPADNDHIAAYTTADGYTLRLRRTGGDFSLDLSPFVSTTVVIAIFAEYGTGVTTFAEIRAYELDPVDEFTIAAELSELVVLGTVTVPASGVIPENDIDPTYRTLAWDHVGSDSSEWEQVVENGSFELAADDTSFVAADRGFVPHWDTQYIPTQHTWSIDSSNPHTGDYALKCTGTGVAPPLGSVIPTDRIIAVQPGQLIRASFWVRGENWPVIGAAGTMGIQLNFYGHQLSFLAYRVIQDKSLNGTFGWTKVDSYIEVPFTPSGIEWCVPSIVVLDSPTPATVTDSIVFDDIRIWVEKGPPTIPYSSVQDGMTDGGHVVGQLGIAEANVAQFGITQTLDSFVQGILQIHKYDNYLTVNRYRFKRLDDEPFGLLLQEGAIQCAGLNDVQSKGQIPRFLCEVNNAINGGSANVFEIAPPPATLLGRARRYGVIGSTLINVQDVVNAYLDYTAVNYKLDDVTQDAGQFGLYGGSGGTGVGLLLAGHAAADGTPFVFWEALMQFLADPTAAAPYCNLELRDGKLRYSAVTALSNPAAGAAITVNSLYSKNIPKAWAYITTDGSGGDVVQDGFGFSTTIAKPSNNIRRLTLLYTPPSNSYLILVNQQGTGTPVVIMAGNPFGTNQIDVGGWDTQAIGAWNFNLTVALNFSILVFGQQN